MRNVGSRPIVFSTASRDGVPPKSSCRVGARSQIRRPTGWSRNEAVRGKSQMPATKERGESASAKYENQSNRQNTQSARQFGSSGPMTATDIGSVVMKISTASRNSQRYLAPWIERRARH